MPDDLRPQDAITAPRPDGSIPITGHEGDIILESDGKLINRVGATSEQADWSIHDHDLVADGDYVAEPEDIGGTSVIVFDIESDSEERFGVRLALLDGDGNTLRERSPALLQNVTKLDAVPVDIAADRIRITIESQSEAGSNVISGSITILGGGPSAVSATTDAANAAVQPGEQTIDLNIGGRPNVTIFYEDDRSDGAGFDVLWSSDSVTWNTLETVDLDNYTLPTSGTYRIPDVGAEWVRVDYRQSTDGLAWESHPVNADGFAIDSAGLIYVPEEEVVVGGWTDDTLYAFDAETGDQVWSTSGVVSSIITYGAHNPDDTTPRVLYPDGSNMYAINASDGTIAETTSWSGISGGTRFHDRGNGTEDLYAPGENGLVQFDGFDVTQRWTNDLGIPSDSYLAYQFAIDSSTNDVFTGSTYGVVARVDPQGNTVWRHDREPSFFTGASMVDLNEDDGLLYNTGAVGNGEDAIRAFNADTGAIEWALNPAGYEGFFNAPVRYIANRNIVLSSVISTGSDPHAVFAFDGTTGGVEWSVELDTDDNGAAAPMVVHPPTQSVMVVDGGFAVDSIIHNIGFIDGTKNWSVQTSGDSRFRRMVYDADFNMMHVPNSDQGIMTWDFDNLNAVEVTSS